LKGLNKMKIRLLIFFCFLSIGLKLNAQSENRYIALIFNPKVSYFNSDNADFKNNRYPLIRNDFGFKIYLSKKEKFKFVTGLIYTNKGWKDDYQDLIVKRNFSFLSIPLILDFQLFKKDKISFHLPTGLMPEILIDYDKRTENNEKKYDIDSKYIGNWDNTSFHLGLRLNYKLKENICLIIEPNLNYQILMNEHRRLYDYGLEFSFGYGF